MTTDIIPAGWRREQNSLVRDFAFADFSQALAFVNQVAKIAEAENHHPDILLFNYKKARLTIQTHETGSLTDQDFHLAEAINNLKQYE